MAEIILFNDKRSGRAGSSSSATAYAVQTHVNQDWDNQELADLYRVKRLLDQAGVIIETDRGITDEGDPWFVFCHPNGDVFVHLSRFDGEYLLDSTSVDAPLRGKSFADLINAFVDRAIEKRAANIVSLRPGEGVFLHPAIMLTALIWTLFVASDELVGIAHGAEIDQSAGDFDILLNAPLAETDGAFGILQAAMAERDADEGSTDDAPAAKNNADPTERETQVATTTSILPNPISLSLSAIAVTFGMSSKSSFEFLQNSETTSQADEQTGTTGLDLSATEQSQDVVSSQEAAGDELASARDVNAEQDTASNAQEKTPQTVDVFNVPNALLLAKGPGADLVASDLDITFASSFDAGFAPSKISTRGQEPGAKTASQNKQGETNSSTSAAESADKTAESNASHHIELNFGYDVSLSAYSVDNQELFASFDISTVQGFDWNTVLGQEDLVVPTDEGIVHKPTGGTIRASQVTEYSQEAMTFVKFLLAERDTVEMVVLEGKIILVDLSAFDDVTDISYLRSWAYDDVGIVSTIGHLSDFEAFNLVIA